MLTSGMGSNSLISPAEAAKLLNTDRRGLRRLVKGGFLREHAHSDKPAYHREEVAALRETRESRLSPRRVASYAARAYAAARSIERRVEMLEAVFDLKARCIPCDEESAIALYVEAQEALEFPPSRVDDVLRWASVFLAIGEEFLDLLEAYTDDDECWRPFYDLSQRMLAEKPTELFFYDKILETAYGFLEASVRHITSVCFFHVRQRAGVNTANRIFHEEPSDEYEELLAIISANRIPI